MMAMKCFFVVLSSLFFAGLTAASVWAHGVEGYLEPAQGYCVTALYDDGEPMSYAAVEITAPESGSVFQTGRTDRNGCFMFRPDGSGRWQAVVKDGMGHRVALELAVDGAQPMPPAEGNLAPAASQPVTRALKITAGLSIILGLTGFAYGWKARNKSGKTR
jgi:nickel transport protein